jgi:GntR family uxuAB operon transcriptional repressor
MASSDDIFNSRPDVDKEVRAYQTIGNSLLDRIRTGEFRAIGKLPTERELAEVYGVGRAVIRDALVMLEVKGLVQSRQGSGIYITRKAYEIDPVKSGDVKGSPPWDKIPSAGPFELLLARQWLESHIARLAATQASDEDLILVQQAYDDYRKANFGEARDSLDVLFHMAVARATQNAELVVIVGQLWMRRDNNPFWKTATARIHDPQNRQQWDHDYRRLIEALRRRDGDGAYVAMWQHIEHLKLFLSSSEGFDDSQKAARPASRRKLKQNV